MTREIYTVNAKETNQNWLDSLLIKMGGDRQGIKEMRLAFTYAAGCLLWAAISAISDVALENRMVTERWIWPVVILPIAITPVFFYAYYRFYTGMDELARKIQGAAMIMAFGATIFILATYMSLANVGIAEPGVNEMLSFMAVAYSLALIFQTIRYHK